MRAVPVLVVGMSVVADEVVAGYKQAVGQVGGLLELLVCFVGDAGIEDGDDDIGRACRYVPDAFGVDAVLCRALEVPLVGIERVIGDGKGIGVIVQLGIPDFGSTAIGVE